MPRRVHELIPVARAMAERLTGELGRPARTEEVAVALGVSVDALPDAEEAARARAASSLDVAADPWATPGDVLRADDRPLARAEDRIALSQALEHLSGRDRLILDLSFSQELSQRPIGERFEVSQMQVSRWVNGAVARLCGHLIAC